METDPPPTLRARSSRPWGSPIIQAASDASSVTSAWMASPSQWTSPTRCTVSLTTTSESDPGGKTWAWAQGVVNRSLSLSSFLEIMPRNVRPVDNPSSPQRSVYPSSSRRPVLPPLGRRRGHAAWPPLGSGTSEECAFCERFPCDSAFGVTALT